jgi:hypothetical protein
MLKLQAHNWIGKPWLEVMGILAVPFACCLVLFFLPAEFIHNDVLPESLWLFLIVFIDVGHVYSTVYRTYADKETVSKHKNLFVGLPVLLLVISVVLHSISGLLFWRCLAYLAVYHFIRQQYGFLKIYSRKDADNKIRRIISVVTIYTVTALPVLYWHVSPGRRFSWFIPNDFIMAGAHPLLPVLIVAAFWLVVTVYGISEIVFSIKTKTINVQKHLVVMGTALSWYIGIVYYNSDFVFTFLNVVCHGIPYMALVWIHGKKLHAQKGSFLKIIYGRFTLLLFLLPLFFVAYVEEGFWDSLVWKEHGNVFSIFKSISISIPKQALNILVPLLALPQLFHYVIDGLIWRIRKDSFNWTKIL